MNHLQDIDYSTEAAADCFDELPLWSAPFGLMLLERVPVRTGQTIVDVGCGTGFLSIELAQRCGPTSVVIAVDPWTAAIARLRRKIAFLGLNNIQIVEGDAAKMGLGDAEVDVLVSNLGIHNFDEPSTVLEECFRVAKPGASLCVTTNLAGHMSEFYEVYRATLDECGLDAGPLDTHVDRRGTVDTIAELLQKAGFNVVETAKARFRMRFANGSTLLNHYFIRLGFVKGWKSLVAPGLVEPFFKQLEQNLNVVARKQGELALTIPMAYIEGHKPRV
jgi:arsenite methyltransferase